MRVDGSQLQLDTLPDGRALFYHEVVNMSEYMSVQETAKKWGVSGQRVRLLCFQGRVEGIERLGKAYMIPRDAVKPNRQGRKRA